MTDRTRRRERESRREQSRAQERRRAGRFGSTRRSEEQRSQVPGTQQSMTGQAQQATGQQQPQQQVGQQPQQPIGQQPVSQFGQQPLQAGAQQPTQEPVQQPMVGAGTVPQTQQLTLSGQIPQGQQPVAVPQAQPAVAQQLPQTPQSQVYQGPQPTFAAGIPAQSSAPGMGQEPTITVQQPQTGVTTQQQPGSTSIPVGSQMEGGLQLMGQSPELYPQAFADNLTDEAREILDDCIDVSQVAVWTADRCLEEGPQSARCARLCNDAATLSAVTAQFIAKDAQTVPAVLDAYIETAEQAADELAKFDTPHTNEAQMVIERSIDSGLDALEGF